VTRNAARLAKPVAHQHAEVDPLGLDESRALLEQVGEHRHARITGRFTDVGDPDTWRSLAARLPELLVRCGA
jgi:hypothetical protein